jgi:uncharacterized protein (DUF1499 family)
MTDSQTDSNGSPSRLARSAALVAGFGALSVVIGLAGVQVGALTPLAAFGMFVLGTLLCGVVGLILGAIAVFVTRNAPAGAGRATAWKASGASLVLLLVVMGAMSNGRGAPPINDITTNVDDPPQFATDLYGDRDMSYPPGFAAQVRAAYPDLAPLATDLPPEDAYRQALAAARALGWEIRHEAPAAGRFDASETTAIFRFVDDVTIRVTPSADGSLIDVRSKSRDGRGDLGANAARIRRFAAEAELPSVASR